MQLKLELGELLEQLGLLFEDDGELNEDLLDRELFDRDIDEKLLDFILDEQLILLQLFEMQLKLELGKLLEQQGLILEDDGEM